MARDIEEFLRKAAERRQQQKAGGPPQQKQPPKRQPPPEIIPEVEAELVRPAPIQRRPSQKPVRKKPLREQPRKQSNLRNQSVAEHVKSHIDTSSIADHAEQLGDRISDVHAQVESRIHDHLDHDISKIDDRPTITDDAPPAIVGKNSREQVNELRKLLANPKSVGQAIILAEILKRPNF
ncbi:MAG: hypothetical protein AB8B55_19205 [Mariniblastus sp.]